MLRSHQRAKIQLLTRYVLLARSKRQDFSPYILHVQPQSLLRFCSRVTLLMFKRVVGDAIQSKGFPKGALPVQASTKQRSLSGKLAGTDTQAEPANALGGSKSSRRASPATAGEAAAQPEEDVPSAAAAGAAGKEAKLLEQDKLTISQPGKDAGAADADQPKDPLQVDFTTCFMRCWPISFVWIL